MHARCDPAAYAAETSQVEIAPGSVHDVHAPVNMADWDEHQRSGYRGEVSGRARGHPTGVPAYIRTITLTVETGMTTETTTSRSADAVALGP